MLQAIYKEVPVRYLYACVTCDCLFQRRDDERENWRLAHNVITS